MLDYLPTIMHTKISKKLLINTYKYITSIQESKPNTPPLDTVLDRSINILTNHHNIAHEIHLQQTIINKSQVPTCYYQPDHDSDYTCGICQNPWHNITRYTIDKRGALQTPLYLL